MSLLPTDIDFDALDQAHAAAKDYLSKIDHRHVFPSRADLAGLSGFDEPLPEQSSSAANIVETLHRLGSPASTAQMGRRYFGFVNGGALPAALAAGQLAGVWDQNAALHKMSPVAAKLEAVCERWIVDLFGLPETTALGLVTGTSMSLACGFVAARNQLLQRQGWDVISQGLFGAPAIRVIVGDAAHGTVWKALSLIGLGRDRVEKIPCDAQGRICPTELPTLDDTCLLILGAGNVNTGAFDDFSQIMPMAQAAKAWVHVDGAFGLWAGASETYRHLTAGSEQANSWSCDAHKTLNTPYDCGLILCREREWLVASMQASGSYIQWADEGARDSMLYTPDMSRRSRGVELWAALKSLGRHGVDALVTQLCERAKQFASGLQQAGYDILNTVDFNQVAVALDSDQETLAALSYIQESGECWVSGASLQNRNIIRVSVCSHRTTPEDVERSIQAFADAKKKAQRVLR